MKCHGDKENNTHNRKHSPMKHMIMMVVCCGLPILIAALVPFLGITNAALKSTILAITPFICPIMMVLMIPMMIGSLKNGRGCHEGSKTGSIECRKIEQ